MSIYRITVRFNMDEETERAAAEFLINLDVDKHKSRNKFIIDLILSYMKNLSAETREETFLKKIRTVFREELQDIAVIAPAGRRPEAFDMTMTDDEKDINAASVLSDLEMFG